MAEDDHGQKRQRDESGALVKEKAKGGGCHQQLLDKLHDWEEIKKPQR